VTEGELFVAHQSWAEMIAARFWRVYDLPAYQRDGATNAALIGLWSSAQAFREPGNFKAFAAPRIWGAMRDDYNFGLRGVTCVELAATDAVTQETGLTILEARETYEEMVACNRIGGVSHERERICAGWAGPHGRVADC
jgi:hypothetical protein